MFWSSFKSVPFHGKHVMFLLYIDICSLSEMGDEVRRVRPSRFLHPDGIVRPFVYHDSEGNQILQVRCNIDLVLLWAFLYATLHIFVASFMLMCQSLDVDTSCRVC